MEHFGPHLTIDGYHCDVKKLKDFDFVYKILNDLPDKIGMTKIMLPYVVKWKDKGSTVDGISGFVMIAESHVSIHTFPQTNYITADVYSCKEFDTEKAVEYFRKAFGIREMEVNLVKRGRTIKARPVLAKA
ncbi:MAG: adenosylmethionine decarboxylase [Candidatus Diapherotrites archaeon]